jgi:CDP-diacylglycerol--serine O-phosphatidyltransferase
MSDPADQQATRDDNGRGDGPGRRGRLLASVSVLPTLCTVANGLSGFASIHFSTLAGLEGTHLWHLKTAAWLIVLSMVFDMLDGRLARMTRNTSDFGGQLDSLCDAVSFGAAPAMLMIRTVHMALGTTELARLDWLNVSLAGLASRTLWSIGAVYLACAVLRLARFNVENEPAEEHHLTFKGLPSPGAAAGVISLVILLAHLAQDIDRGLLANPGLMLAVVITLPLVTLTNALLMVSNLPYPHLTNRFQLSDKPFGTIVWVVIIGIFAALDFIVTGTVIALVYALSGPGRAIWLRIRDRSGREAG